MRCLRIPFGIKSRSTRKMSKKRQTEHVLDLPSVAVIADDDLVFGFGNKKITKITIR